MTATAQPICEVAPPDASERPFTGGMRRPLETIPAAKPAARRYISTSQKFAMSSTFAFCWLGLSIWISLSWIRSAERVFHLVPALILISTIAFIPGVLVAFLAASLVLDRQPKFVE
ncbi:MAG: hypothetical protein ACRDZP_06545, partial [Acidimicrobiales bacterium]